LRSLLSSVKNIDFANATSHGDPLLSSSLLLHVHNAANAVARFHVLERLVDAAQWLAMRDELVNLELAGHVVVNKSRQLSAALDTAESAALPPATRHELECC